MELLLVIGIGLMLGLFVFVFIDCIITFASQSKYDFILADASNSIRIYIIDLNNEKVEFFNRANLKKRYAVPLVEFYNFFPSSEREEIIDWITDLTDKDKDTSSFKEAHVISRKRKSNFYSLLQVEKVNYKSQVVYISSFLIKPTANRKSKKDNSYKLSSQENYAKILASSYYRGVTFAFNFFDKRNKDEEVARLIFLQFINIFNNYVTSYRPIMEYGNHQIIISDLHAYSRQALMRLIASLKSDINTYLLISSNQDKIGYTIGVAENRYFVKDCEKLVNTVISLSEQAQIDEEHILFFEKRKQGNENFQENYRTEVERIIRDKRLKYLYRPIVNLEKGQIFAYLSFIEPQDSFFGSIKELKDYALRTEDDRTLFATIARNTITRFAEEKDGESIRLFLNINNLEKNYVNRTLAHISNIKDIHIVLVYSEEELGDLPENGDEALVNEIRIFKSKGYEVALEISDNDLTLSSIIYSAFDFFVVDVNTNLKIGNKYSQRSLYTFRGLVEKLLRFHRPIIATDIPSWDTVELINKLGINYISSDVISLKSENVLPLSTKTLIKIKNIKNK